jgi:hypothetical protein
MSSHAVAKRKALRAVVNEPVESQKADTPTPPEVPATLAPLPQAALSWAVLWGQFSAVAVANLVLMSSIAMDSIAATRRRADADRDAGA